MSGLRARQKADRHRRIMEAAAALFREAGYEGAKIEAIAAQAEVSIGTIYNYYQNKGDILGRHRLDGGQRGAKRRERRGRQPAGQCRRCAWIRCSASMSSIRCIYLSKEMWRQAMAISTQLPDSPFGQAYTGLDRALTEQICALIARLQEIGLVRADIDGPALGELIFNNMNMMFIEFVKRDEAKIPELRAAIRRQNRILVAAIAV